MAEQGAPKETGLKQAGDFPREVLTLFDQYVHGALSRRGFLEQAALYTGSAVAATSLLTALSPDFANAQQIAPTDTRISVATVKIPSPQGYGTINAYVAKPVGTSPTKRKPVIVVVHENRGLNLHIEDIARRLAVDGFIAIAPDALTTLGGYPGDEDKARTLFQQLDQVKTHADFLSAAYYAQKLPDGTGKLGAVGFCYGGEVVNMLATLVPTLRAAVPFYGAPPRLGAVPNIKAKLLLNFAGNDTRVNAMWPAYEAALKAAKIDYQAYVYPDVEHGFNNDTTPRFNKDAAALAWSRTLALFRKTLT